MVEHCQRGVELSHYGGCTNTTATQAAACPQSCVGERGSGPVCGSDGNVYSSQCELSRQTCGQVAQWANSRA